MADAKDILGLPKGAFSAEKRSKPTKENPKKPDGVHREVYALTGGLPPIMPALDISSLKKRPRSATRKLHGNGCLSPHLLVKLVDNVAPTGDYYFARYNKKIDVVRYTEEEYAKIPQDPSWSKEETDQLFDLCEQFDLRFIVIADRFNPPRSIEELKSRYYTAAKAIVLSRAATPEEANDHTLVKESYITAHEIERKRALGAVLSQSRQQEREEAEALAEAKRASEARSLKKQVVNDVDSSSFAVESDNMERAPSTPARPGSPSPVHPSRPSASTAAGPSLTSAFVAALNGSRLPRVFTRGTLLTQLVHSIVPPGGARLSKRVEQTLEELGVQTKPKVPTQAVCVEHLELRKEVVTMLNLKKQLQWRGSEVSSLRDNPYGDIPATPSTPKRSHRSGDNDRPWTMGSDPDIYPERSGKREHKRKAPVRFSDGPPSPPSHKRPRKLKASDL